jgi:hypothetical protein
MKPGDIAVWDRYILKNPDIFDSVNYDMALGKGADPHPDHAEEIQRDHTILTQKKVDVVGYKDGIVYVIEVKPIANARALGQILTYVRLYKIDHPDDATVVPMVVCESVEREMLEDFFEHGIVVMTA